jgi:hypothetical protein
MRRGHSSKWAVDPRGPVIRSGVEPARDARPCARQPCKRRSPRQERSPGRTCAGRIGPQTGVEAQKSTPRHPPIDRLFDSHVFPTGGRSSRRKSIGTRGRSGENGTWVRSDRNAAGIARSAIRPPRNSRGATTRTREQTCEGHSEPQERRRARNCSGGHTRTSVTRLPVDVCVARMAEGRTTRLARPRESPEPW